MVVPMDDESLDFFRRAQEVLNQAREQQNSDVKEELLRIATQWTLLGMAVENLSAESLCHGICDPADTPQTGYKVYS